MCLPLYLSTSSAALPFSAGSAVLLQSPPGLGCDVCLVPVALQAQAHSASRVLPRAPTPTRCRYRSPTTPLSPLQCGERSRSCASSCTPTSSDCTRWWRRPTTSTLSWSMSRWGAAVHVCSVSAPSRSFGCGGCRAEEVVLGGVVCVWSCSFVSHTPSVPLRLGTLKMQWRVLLRS